jgi:hypothetical protein
LYCFIKTKQRHIFNKMYMFEKKEQWTPSVQLFVNGVAVQILRSSPVTDML